jgi:hypothetical protein
MSYPQLLWAAWRDYARRAGRYQTLVWLNVLYFAILGPSALAARLFGAQLLDLDRRPRPSYWIARPPLDAQPPALERQF